MPRTRRQQVIQLPRDFAELVRMHPPRAIHDEAEYDNTQEMIDALTSIPTLSKGQSEYLDTLTILFSAYEREHHAIDTSDITPAALLKNLIAENGLKQSDLVPLLGSASRVSEIISGTRAPSKSQAIALGKRFNMDAGAFL